jgi:hypothetical protein
VARHLVRARLIIAGITHQGWDVQLTAYAARDWRANFFGRDRALHRGRHGVGDDAVASGAAGGVGGGEVMDDPTPVIAALRRSGFPLQTRVEHEIHARTPDGWRVAASEHPWIDEEGREQFIDLIASCGNVVLVVECKKAQERSLLFLRPVGGETTGLVKTLTVWHLQQSQGAGTRSGIDLRDDIHLEPGSYRSQFCVSTYKAGQTSQRLLEPDARLVVLAAEALVNDASMHPLLPPSSLIVPVIVTTARLSTIRFDPTEVPLDSGEFNPDPNRIEAADCVRFHKTLTASDNRPRTVIVVNAVGLPVFLQNISSSRHLPTGA